MSRDTGYYWLVTFTAPGDVPHCLKAGCKGHGDGFGCPHKRCPCTGLYGTNLADWNAQHGKRWNRLLTSIRRAYPSFVFMRGCEVQDGKRREDGMGRGALHDHCVAWTDEPMDVRMLRRLAMRAGFGHSVDLERVSPTSSKAAEYVSKYVGKSVDERGEVPWFRFRRVKPTHSVDGVLWDGEGGYSVQLLDEDGADWVAWTPVEPSPAAAYRAWSKSRAWGVTMQQVRAAAREYAAMMETKRAQAQADPDAPGTDTIPAGWTDELRETRTLETPDGAPEPPGGTLWPD